MSPLRNTVIAVLFGPPGSGKGTQAGFISEAFNLTHVSTGDVLRSEVAQDTPLGREVKPIMDSGELVPDDLMMRVLESTLARGTERSGFLFDGFPRTLPQAEAFDAMLASFRRKIEVLLVLDVPEEELHARILRRAAAEGRADDTPETVRTRLEVYDSETRPVLTHYEEAGDNVQHIDGVGTVDEVQERIRKAFEPIVRGRVAP